MTFILNEDKALKSLLTGITVSDEKNPSRPVGVWFGQPDIEIQSQSYPYITIDLIDVSEATDRAMRGTVSTKWRQHLPEGVTPPIAGETIYWDYPVPYNLDYQVTSWARHPRHDRAIIEALYRTVLTPKYRSLYIPEDDSVRSLFVLNFTKRDFTDQQRKVFSNVLTVRVHSEMLLSDAAHALNVKTVNLTAHDIDT